MLAPKTLGWGHAAWVWVWALTGVLAIAACDEAAGESETPVTGAGSGGAAGMWSPTAGTGGAAGTGTSGAAAVAGMNGGGAGAQAGAGGNAGASGMAGMAGMAAPIAGMSGSAGQGGGAAGAAAGTGGMAAAGTGGMAAAGTGGQSGAGGQGGEGGSGEDEVPFSDVYAIISARCSNCHTTGSSGGLAMPNAATAHANLVGVASQECSGETRVVAGDADASLLIKAIEGTACVDRMPRGRAALGADDIATFRAWIDSGAAAP